MSTQTRNDLTREIVAEFSIDGELESKIRMLMYENIPEDFASVENTINDSLELVRIAMFMMFRVVDKLLPSDGEDDE